VVKIKFNENLTNVYSDKYGIITRSGCISYMDQHPASSPCQKAHDKRAYYIYGA